MRKGTILWIYPLLLMGVFLVFASSCKKDDDDNGNGNNAGIPVLSTTEVTDITQTTAKSGGNITSVGGNTVTARGVCWSTGQTPTISDNKTTDGTGAGTFVSNISGLTANTTYYARAYATNSKGTAYGSSMSFTTEDGGSAGSFTDPRDGNVYQTVTIGTQVWMAENLRYLPSVVGPGTGSNTTPYYYVYDYDGTDVNAAKGTSNYSTYGVLYNWTAAVNACPTGWHLPSDDEWTELTDYLGGTGVAGGKLKETGTTHWFSPNTGATNETGFTALPGGYRGGNGAFNGVGGGGSWWSATEYGTGYAWGRGMLYDGSDVGRGNGSKELGFSVRCLRD
ncbi:MAG: FISUMP domain-containing protein [Bacteroidales bacterium]|nr:FISUMP domain-containing protein [Bacteroidales bacterium]